MAAMAAGLLSLSPMGAHALVGGSNTSSYAAVGDIGGASGVLIADNWVLTANHVAAGLVAGTDSFVSTAGSSLIDAVFRFSTADFPANDIALVHLSTAIDAGGEPILNDQVVTNRSLNGLGTLTVVTAANQTPNGVGQLTAQSLMGSYTNKGVSYTTNWIVSGSSVHVEGGDSGSALFKGNVADSAGALLLGLASASITDGSGNPMSAFVQVANYKTWIDSTMAASGQKATWLSAVPEPGSGLMMALGLLGLGFVGQRRWIHTRPPQ